MTITQGSRQQFRVMALALCTLAVSAAPMFAQDNSAPPPAQGQQAPMGPGGRRGPEREERQVEMLTRRLQLTPDQVTQVKAIDDAQRAQMMALRNDSSVSQEDRRSKMMALRQDTETKIRAVLTDQQKPQYDECWLGNVNGQADPRLRRLLSHK
jgi:protein CpxP